MKKCLCCLKSFVTKRSHAKYCSLKCRNRWNQLKREGKNVESLRIYNRVMQRERRRHIAECQQR